MSVQIWAFWFYLIDLLEVKMEMSWESVWLEQSLHLIPRCIIRNGGAPLLIPALGRWRQGDEKFKVIFSTAEFKASLAI